MQRFKPFQTTQNNLKTFKKHKSTITSGIFTLKFIVFNNNNELLLYMSVFIYLRGKRQRDAEAISAGRGGVRAM
jgi:hypothetical protein